jgi:hypothetical protein
VAPVKVPFWFISCNGGAANRLQRLLSGATDSGLGMLSQVGYVLPKVLTV